MIRLVRTEFLKVVTIRLPYGLLAATAGLTALVTAIVASRAGHTIGPVGMHIGTGENMLPPLYTAEGLTRVITVTRFAVLFASILGVIVASGEFRHGTATPTYLASPRRGRVMIAKILVAAAIGLLFGAVASGVAIGVGLAFVSAKGFAVAVSGATMLRLAAGAALASGLFAAIGVAVGSLVRQQVAAIVAILAWGLIAEGVIESNFPSAGRYLPFTAATAMSGGSEGGATLPLGAAVAILAALAVLIAVVADRTTIRADIT